MDLTKDIQPMITFRNHSAQFLRHLRKTKRAIVLTVNGKAAAVVQDAEAYQQLLDLAAEVSAAEGIRQGLEDVANGRTRPAREVFDEIRADMTYRVEITARANRNLKGSFPHRCRELAAGVWFNDVEAAILSLDHPPRAMPSDSGE
jgi:prevent-host-death family protein